MGSLLWQKKLNPAPYFPADDFNGPEVFQESSPGEDFDLGRSQAGCESQDINMRRRDLYSHTKAISPFRSWGQSESIPGSWPENYFLYTPYSLVKSIMACTVSGFP